MVTDNSNLEVIKAPVHFKLFEWVKTFFNKLDVTYKRTGTENTEEKYWSEIYDTITNSNECNHAPLSNTRIREEIDQLMLGYQE